MSIKQLPAGRYWIGDPCYVLHEVWDECCEALTGELQHGGVITLKDGRTFACFSTAYGDGTYCDRSERNKLYGVDAGLIGCIRVADIDSSNGNNMLSGGHVHEITHPFEPHADEGVLTFGHVSIDTSGGDEDDSDMYEDDSDEDDEDEGDEGDEA